MQGTQDTQAGQYCRERDLTLFEYKAVGNLPFDRLLALCYTPGGDTIPGYTFVNGEQILIHRAYSMSGWYFAYKNGCFGYVNPLYITDPQIS